MTEDNRGPKVNAADAADVAFQRHLTTLLLDHIGSAGFALAGSGAIREHGITHRLTNDVDLFTTTATGIEAFAAAVTTAVEVLTSRGYGVTRTRTTPQFARLLVETGATRDGRDLTHDPIGHPTRPGDQRHGGDGGDGGDGGERAVEVDFGIDWRSEPPTHLAIGPVLALRDAVGSKIAAVYSRGEARDFLDLDAIRRSGRFTDPDLLALAKTHDPGFELDHFIDQLHWVNRIRPGRTSGYGIDAEHLDQIKTRITTWADHLFALLGDQPADRLVAEVAPEPPLPARRSALRPHEDRGAWPPHGHHHEQRRDNGGPSIGR